MLPGPLVLGAVGPLQGVHPDARRGYDAQGEHEQTKDPRGPRVGCSDHHDWDHRRTDNKSQMEHATPVASGFDCNTSYL